ncbi:MAG: hypothetical protein AAB809_01675 [Patescibacteria group bacterium]
MRGEIIYKILNSLKNGAKDQIDFASAFLQAGYGATSGKINYELHKIQKKKMEKEREKERILKLQKYLSKLKHDGLILENNSKQIYLSEKGKKKLNNFQNLVSSDKYSHSKKISGKVIVVSYDIPIAFNKERRILRDILRKLGFGLVHKSVWVGKVTLPERFVADLSKLGILDYVEILEVTKNGTLKSKN